MTYTAALSESTRGEVRMQGLLERLVVTGVALFALLGIAACDDSVRPATSGSGGGPGAGSGGDGGSPGTTGDGGSPGGGGSGVAGSGGSAGANGAGAGGDGGFAGTTLTTDPWPTSCVPEANLPRPAGESLLTGPAGSSGFGEPAQPGETMTATLNGFPRAWTRFEMTASGFTGYSYDGSLAFTLPSLAPGTYSCPAAALDWANLNAGGRDSNSAWTMACCTIQITTGGGAIGDPIEGTFSGILVHVPLNSWIKVEDGHFRIFQRSPGTGGFTGNTGP